MKDWFPFTSYDFFAYLASGSLLIAALDATMNNGGIIAQKEWPFAQIILLVAAAYVAGHLVASLSSWLLERLLARKLLSPPAQIALGVLQPTRFQRVFAAVFIAEYYKPLKKPIVELIFTRAADVLKVPVDVLKAEAQAKDGTEQIFPIAHAAARATPESSARLDNFLNQYGFCRNIAMVAFIATCLFATRSISYADQFAATWALISLVVALGMTARFLKFYSTFAVQVLTALAK